MNMIKIFVVSFEAYEAPEPRCAECGELPVAHLRQVRSRFIIISLDNYN